MAKVDLAYARALIEAAPLGDLARAAVRRMRRRVGPAVEPLRVSVEVRAAGADALGRAPAAVHLVAAGRAVSRGVPDALVRFERRGRQILDHEIEIFGRSCALGPRIDWERDPISGTRGGDPKGQWELARGGHLVELGAAARLHPELLEPARHDVRATIERFLDACPVGLGIHYTSSLEVALRAIHWLAAIELCGGASAFPRSFVERLAGALLADGHFLVTHLEDSGVAPANHLLGDLVGLYVLGLALDGTPPARRWVRLARRGIEREAARQVGADGAHFEASTAYHRFALELLLVAFSAARAHGVDLPVTVTETLHRMFGFARGYLQPDGSEPGFGDSDDARLLPMVPRAPRDHGYLASLGVGLFGDPALRAPGLPFAEEALWWIGPEAHRAWQWVPASADARSASFPSGGVHVLRDRDVYVALRSGSHGQHGVGGHAHNDQLSLVIHAGGAPLIIDPGTGCYTADALMRDRFRGTAAHATLVVDGCEQSPILDGRPFALPDRARAPRVTLEELGEVARLSAEHHGYQRLPARVTHRRTLVLHRRERVLLIDDQLAGRGRGAVELRFPIFGTARLGARPATRARIAELTQLLGPVDLDRVVELDGRAALVPLGASALSTHLEEAPASLRYGEIMRLPLVTIRGLLRFPTTLRHALLFVG